MAPSDNGELGLLFHELIMIRMLSDSIDSGQYRDNEDFWREKAHVEDYKLEQGRRNDDAGLVSLVML